MKTTELDALLKKKLSQITIVPQKDSWIAIQAILQKRRKRRVVYRFAATACVVTILSGTFAFYTSINRSPENYEHTISNIPTREKSIQKETISKADNSPTVKAETRNPTSKKNIITTSTTNTSATQEVYEAGMTNETRIQVDMVFLEKKIYNPSPPEVLKISHITLSPIFISKNISTKKRNIWTDIVVFFQKAENFHQRYSFENILKPKQKIQIEYAYLVEIKINKKY